MSQPIPRFVIVRASAAIAGMLAIAAAVFFTIRYFEHQTALLDEQQAEREAAAKNQTGAGKSSGHTGQAPRGKDGRIVPNADGILKDFREKSDAYAKAFSEFKEAGMVRSFTLPSLAAIKDRGEKLKKLEEANRTLVDALKNAEETAKAEFQKQGISEQQSETLAARFVADTNLNALLELRNCDHELCDEFRRILDLLESAWGSWKPQSDDIVIFDSVANANLYNTIHGEIVETGLRQRALQKKVLEKAKNDTVAEPKKPARYDADFIGPRP